MAEYVTKEQVIDWYRPYGHTDEHIPFETLVSDLRDMKAADVAPARHGRWTTTYGEVFPGSSQFLCYSHKHEECGFQYVDMDDNEYDYCPKCGAKMDGKT